MSKFFERRQQLFKEARQVHVLKWGLQHKATTAFPSGMWVGPDKGQRLSTNGAIQLQWWFTGLLK